MPASSTKELKFGNVGAERSSKQPSTAPPPSLSLNMLDQMTFYGMYHHNHTNQLIHIVFVPLILWTAWVFLAYTPAALQIPTIKALPMWVNNNLIGNGALIGYVIYAAYYLALDFKTALPYTVLLFFLQLGAQAFVRSNEKAWVWALAAHVLSWFMQIQVGHLTFEHRKPALMDSFFQSIVLAPYFVWVEALFMLGYKPEFQAKLNKRVEEGIKLMDSRNGVKTQ